jgi:hypothetical protein
MPYRTRPVYRRREQATSNEPHAKNSVGRQQESGNRQLATDNGKLTSDSIGRSIVSHGWHGAPISNHLVCGFDHLNAIPMPATISIRSYLRDANGELVYGCEGERMPRAVSSGGRPLGIHNSAFDAKLRDPFPIENSASRLIRATQMRSPIRENSELSRSSPQFELAPRPSPPRVNPRFLAKRILDRPRPTFRIEHPAIFCFAFVPRPVLGSSRSRSAIRWVPLLACPAVLKYAGCARVSLASAFVEGRPRTPRDRTSPLFYNCPSVARPARAAAQACARPIIRADHEEFECWIEK